MCPFCRGRKNAATYLGAKTALWKNITFISGQAGATLPTGMDFGSGLPRNGIEEHPACMAGTGMGWICS